MATGGSYQDDKSLTGMDCPICLTVYKDPRTLACCHTFCLDCLTEFISKTKEEVNSKNGITCPICRAVTKINKSDIAVEEFAKQLHLNYSLVSVLQLTSANFRAPNCQPCQTNGDSIQATVFCQNCKEYQCDSCASAHKKFGVMKDHTIINLSGSADRRENKDFSHLMQCNEHGKRIKFYCNTHKALCCSTCALTVHKQCDNIEVKHVKQANNSIGLRADFSELKDNFGASCCVIDENSDSSYSEIANVEKKLTVVRSRVLKRLDEFERRIRAKLEVSKKSLELNSVEKKSTTYRIKAALQGSIQVLDSVGENASLEAKVIVLEKLKEQKGIYQTALKDLLTDVKSTNISLAFCNELEMISESNDELGHLESRSGQVKLTRKVGSLKVMKIIDLKETENKQEPMITGLDVFSVRRIIMIDCMNNECLIMNEMLHLISSHTLPYRPHCVTVLSTNEVLISSEHGIKMYKVTNDNKLHFIEEIKVTGKVCSVCETNYKDEVVACLYDTNDPIRVIARRGSTISSVDIFPDVEYTRNSIYCAFSKINDCIVVSLSLQNEIRIIDYNTKATQIIKNDSIKYPTCAATNDSLFGNLFVCSRDTHSIVQMTFQGILLSVHKLDMFFPHNIAISVDNKRLIVSNARKYQKTVTLLHLIYARIKN